MATPSTSTSAASAWDLFSSDLATHKKYQAAAKLNERFYLGAGGQWSEADKKELDSMGKPWLEQNMIFSTVNTVLGYQTQSRMDISYKPRESDDQVESDVMTKLGMFVVDQNAFPWIESQVFADGMIQQRGFFDIRMGFEENANGEVIITDLDPLDVIPDPNGRGYDPDTWERVSVMKVMPVSEIKVLYGSAKYSAIMKEASKSAKSEIGGSRSSFTSDTLSNGAESRFTEGGVDYIRVIDKQYYKLTNRMFWVDEDTGDLEPVPDGMPKAEAEKLVEGQSAYVMRKPVRRIRWSVSTPETLLHDEWSPYEHFTVVPFFPYFRRGKTLGLVDNLIKTQEMVNKTYSQMAHVVNTTANSGWLVEENALVNMEVEELEEYGALTGLVLEYKKGYAKPEKIGPNQIPQGLQNMATTGVNLIRMISGVTETFQGGQGSEVSGVAIQSRVHQSAVQLATPIDNLFRTRNMIAGRLLKLLQAFYTGGRTVRITAENTEGEPEDLAINQDTPEGIMNDISVGKYDVVISDVPTQITFQNAQLKEAVELRKFGIEIPDKEMIRLSTLARKEAIIAQMEQGPSPEEEEERNLQIGASTASTAKVAADTQSTSVKSAQEAIAIAKELANNPSLAATVQSILKTNAPE